MPVSVGQHIGSELLGYRIDALLGRSSTSVVYRAEHLRLKRKVALKLLAPELAEDERFRERFLRESELAASLDHGHIVPIYDAGELEGQLYIAMRYVPGGDLRGLLRQEGRLAPGRAMALLAQVADALDTAHEAGLVHRDVKPANVLLDSREHCYLADFGLTQQVSSQSGLTAIGEIAGTVNYAAPEVIEGKGVARQADIYSLGCVLFECLVGEPPFRRDSEFAVLWAHVNETPPRISQRRPGLPASLDHIFSDALAKEPARRPVSARHLIAGATEAVASPPPTAPGRRRRTRLLVAAAVAALGVGLALVLSLLLTGRASGQSTKPTIAITTDSIQRIDPSTNRLVATIPVGSDVGLQAGYQVAVGGGAVWVANSDRNRIYRIDPRRNTWQELPGNGAPFSLAFGAGFLWVTNQSDAILSQVDPSTGVILHTVALPAGLVGGPIAVSPHAVLVAEQSPRGYFVRVDPTTLAQTVLGKGDWQLAYGEGAFWTTDLPHGLVRLDARTARPVASGAFVGDTAIATIAAGEGSVWVNVADAVVQIDPDRVREVKRFPRVGAGWALSLGYGSLWLADATAGRVVRVDLRTGRVIATIDVGPNPSDIALGEGAVWVAGHPAIS